jgi:site-specific recombinase XerD
MMIHAEIENFCKHLQARNYSRHTMSNYAIDLRLFFAEVDKPLRQITWREVDQFVESQHNEGLAATTINRRLNAVKRFFDFRVSEVANLKMSNIDWEQEALLIEQGKGRKDRRLYLSADALASLQECLQLRPSCISDEHFFWNQKRKNQGLSIKAIQKKMERYAKASQVVASCHSLRHTFASNLLEEGAEVISIKEFLGHESISSSERYARLSNPKIKQIYLQTIKKVIEKTKV